MKKTYIQPQMKYVMAEEEALLASQSTLDPNQDNQGVTPSEEEYNDEFSTNSVNVWDDW